MSNFKPDRATGERGRRRENEERASDSKKGGTVKTGKNTHQMRSSKRGFPTKLLKPAASFSRDPTGDLKVCSRKRSKWTWRNEKK